MGCSRKYITSLFMLCVVMNQTCMHRLFFCSHTTMPPHELKIKHRLFCTPEMFSAQFISVSWELWQAHTDCVVILALQIMTHFSAESPNMRPKYWTAKIIYLCKDPGVLFCVVSNVYILHARGCIDWIGKRNHLKFRRVMRAQSTCAISPQQGQGVIEPTPSIEV